jgi:senataxin
MLWLEAWAGLQSAKGELAKGSGASSNIQVTGRTATDSFVVLTVTLQVQHSQKPVTFNDADVVYLREAGSSAAQPKCVLAKVDAYKFDGARKLDRLTLRCCLQSDTQGMTSLLTGGATLEMGKLFSLTTLHREYEALQVVQYYNLLPSILLAKCSIRETVPESDIRQVEGDYGVNRPQAEAILSALKAEQGFNLIQGPPGTGKTKTICSLVAHFIQTRIDAAVPIRAGQAGAGANIKKKILLCAPSNAAVDEVARRVFEGVQLKNGKIVKPSVVRLGRDEAMNNSVKSFSLESIVERKLASTGGSASQSDASDDVSQVQSEIRSLSDERNMKRAELENARLTKMNDKIIQQLDSEVRAMTVRRMDLMNRLDEVKDKRQTVHRQHNADRKRIEQDVLAEADVVCATLGGAGHNLLCDLPFDFETVVIDEAAQAVEMDTLIPLRYGCQRCILVGDPNQLPPTVISQEAEKLRYSRSLFVRLFNNPNNYSYLLSIQYRMHPTISKFPSTEFYESKLIDGPGMATLTAKQWHKDSLLGPFRFFNCANSREASGRGMSLINREEALMAAAIYERLRKEALRLGNQSMDGRVGVISMYKEQIFELKRAFEGIYGKGIDSVVDFNTVDGFQGQEKDAIILSCVRSNGIGFLSDFRRVNVAITRAKSNLFIIGNSDNLERAGQGTIWPRLIGMAKAQNCFMNVTREMFQRPAFAQAPAPAPRASPTKSINGTAGPSQAVSKATSPVKRKASATFSPLDVAAKTVNKRPHLAETAATKSGQNGNSSPRSLPTGPVSMRPRPHPYNESFSSNPRQNAHSPRPANVSRPPGRPPARPAQLAATKKPVPILPPGEVANAPRPPPRPAQLYRPPRFSSQEGPSDKAKSSLFMPKSNRPGKPRKG